MIQIYTDDERGLNYWLKQGKYKKVIDIKMSSNDQGEIFMVMYDDGEKTEREKGKL